MADLPTIGIKRVGQPWRRRASSAIQRLLARYGQFWARLVVAVRRPVIVGITGTVGKTTTVQMLSAILTQPEVEKRLGPVACTTSNMNDAWGLPLALLGRTRYFSGPLWRQLPAWAMLPVDAVRQIGRRDYPRLWVLEFAAGNKGDLHRLVRVARPHIGVITSIGAGHLGRLGGIDGVMEEKSALASAPPPEGAVIIGAGHAYVDELARRARAPVTVVEGEGLELNRNIARAMAEALGVSEELVERGLARAEGATRRLQRLELGALTIIDDSHNANPLSMKLGLDTLGGSRGPGRRALAVLGRMAEFGPLAEEAHRDVGSYARSRADVLVGVGEEARLYQPDLWFATVEQCAADLGAHLREGDTVLIKASNSVGLWRVGEALAADPRWSRPVSKPDAGPSTAFAAASPPAAEHRPFLPATDLPPTG